MNSYDVAYNNYLEICDRLRSDTEEYARFLKFSSGIYKHGFSDAALIYRQNPNATKVADLKTWNRLGRKVNKGEHSVVTFTDNGRCNYLFDVSQTSGRKEPVLWRMNDDIVNRVNEKLNTEYGLSSSNLDETIAKLAADAIKTKYSLGKFPDLYNSLSTEDKKTFNRSVLSASRYIIANRCMHGGDVELATSLDLNGLKLCRTAEDFRHFGSIIHETAQENLRIIENKVLEAMRDRAMERELALAEETLDLPFTVGSTFEINDTLYAVEEINIIDRDTLQGNVLMRDISSGEDSIRNMELSDLILYFSEEQRHEQLIDNALDNIIGNEPIIANESVSMDELLPPLDEKSIGTILSSEELRYERNGSISDFFSSEPDPAKRTDYIRDIFHDSGEIQHDGITYGITKTENGLKFYEMSGDDRTKQCGLSFDAISAKYADMFTENEIQVVFSEPETAFDEIGITELSAPTRRIQCETPEEAEKLLSSLRADDYTWIDGEELDRTDWIYGEENTYYSINEDNKTVEVGNISSLSPDQINSFNIEKFSDVQNEFITGAEFTEQEEHKYDLYYIPQPDRMIVTDLNSESNEPIAEFIPDRNGDLRGIQFNIDLPDSVKHTIEDYAHNMPPMFIYPEIREPLSGEPMVTIKFSESGYFPKEAVMPFSQANEIFTAAERHFIESKNNNISCMYYLGYAKTDFEIEGKNGDEPFFYNGRFDIGDGQGSLIQHIRDEYEYSKNEYSRMQTEEPEHLFAMKEMLNEFEYSLEYLNKYESYEKALKSHAISLIDDYCDREFGEPSNSSDLSHIGLAFTTDEETELQIEVYADLENFRIVTEYDGVSVKEDAYNDLDDMCRNGLDGMTFDDLIYLTDEEKQKRLISLPQELYTAMELPEYGLSIDLKDVDALKLNDEYSYYEGGIDSNGHERKDNFSLQDISITIKLNDNGKADVEEYNSLSEFDPFSYSVYDLSDEKESNELRDKIAGFIKNSENITITSQTGEETRQYRVREEGNYSYSEQIFLEKDLTPDISDVLSRDEYEDLSYLLYEDRNWNDMYKTMSFGNGLTGEQVFDMAQRIRNGENISEEFGKAVLGNDTTGFFRLNSKWNKEEVSIRHGEHSLTVSYNDLEREIQYSAIGEHILDMVRKEHIDIEVYKAAEDNTLPKTRFTSINDKTRKFLDNHQYVSVPTYTPWGEPQQIYEINKGIFEVSTASHGGIMIRNDIADKVLSPEAREIGFRDSGFHCFEEDCDCAVALRELIDKGMFRDIEDYFNTVKGVSYSDNIEKYNDSLNDSIRSYFEDYYHKRNEVIYDALIEKRIELSGQMMFTDVPQAPAETAPYENKIIDALLVYDSPYKGMVTFVGDDNKTYLGKAENVLRNTDVINGDKYDNSDGSLVYLSDNQKIHRLLSTPEIGSTITQQEAIDRNIYTLEDYREFTRLQNGILSAYEQAYPIRFNGEDFKPVSDETILVHHDKGKAQNYRYDPADIVQGGQKAKYNANVEAIKVLYTLEKENRYATQEEQAVLAGYSGWGGIPQAFDNQNDQWKKEYEELKTLLSDSEYKAARSSTNTAFYTPPEVTDAVYQALSQFGFEGGKVLEPSCGIGNFIAKMPETISENSVVHGVEIDSISGRIAQKLYPKADIQVKGFEQTTFPDNSFDVVVGNIPFGDFGVNDKAYNKLNFKIHDYFAAKAIDKTKEGGIVAIVTSKFTMDKKNEDLRRYIAQRAELLGAVRLPAGTFKDADGITTDILFFHKKQSPTVDEPSWVHFGQTSDGVPCNQYFVDHPEMVLGKMEFDKRMQGKYGEDSKVTVCSPTEGNLKDKLSAAISKISGNISVQKSIAVSKENADIIPANPNVRNFTHTLVDGQLYYRDNDIMRKVTDTGLKLKRMIGLHEIRQATFDLINAQVANCTDKELDAYQKKLNDVYDSFVDKYGHVQDNVNAKAFANDDDYNTIRALEILDKKTGQLRKAEIFTQRTITAEKEITQVDNPEEALHVSLDKKGKADIEYMAELCGKKPDDIITALSGLIYRDPLKVDDTPYSGYVDKSEYLSGNVREKLDAAKMFAASDSQYADNVTALENALPPTIEAQDISASIGVSWVDVEDYSKFMEEAMNGQMQYHKLRRDLTGEYKIENKNYGATVYSTQTHGTDRMNSYQIFENLLNKRDIVVKDRINEDGKDKYVINRKETEKAKQKGEEMKRAFKEWIFKDYERREKYVTKYNRLFNSIVGRSYDGSHQTFVGMNPAIKLRPHQENAVMRGKLGGNTLLAHCVGAGKSFEIDTIVMEKKRLGLIQKACVVVPKHLTLQTAMEWQRLYPNAKLLVATPKDFEKDKRQEFLAKCVTGDYDGIIMSFEQFGKIPMSRDYQENFMQKQIDNLEKALSETDKSERMSIKDIERTLKKLRDKLTKLLDKPKDESLTFEQMGFDYIVVDEAHYYKNCLVVSKMNNVSGVQTTSAAKSEDMLMKTQFLRDKYGEGTCLMATGTPLSNSMVELYSMTRYLRPDLLQKAELQTFDDWASNFGEVVSQLEMKPAGDGFQMKKRFSKFVNMPELMQMYKEFADIQMADTLHLPNVPEMETGKPILVKSPADELQKEYMKYLAERSEKIHNGAVDPKTDNMLKITHEARLLGLDSRTINQDWKPDPDCKVMKLCDNLEKIYQDTDKDKGVQIVFCDIAIHDTDGRFSVYNAVKEELINRGIPENEICFAGDAKNDKQRAEMFDELRKGQKRIIIASTSKLGTGANVQDRVAAIHHLDIPWRPADLEQQNGRGLRQGNMFKEVGIYHYVTENTFDAYMLGIITSKAKFIAQVMTSKDIARTCEDVDEMVLNYAEMQAVTSGNPLLAKKVQLEYDVATLRMLSSEHTKKQYEMEELVNRRMPELISRNTELLEKAKMDLNRYTESKPDPENFMINIGNNNYDERKGAAEELEKLIMKCIANGGRQNIGNYAGFEIAIEKNPNYGVAVLDGDVPCYLKLKGELEYTCELRLGNNTGNITRIENLAENGIGKRVNDIQAELEKNHTNLKAAEEEIGKPFPQAEELANLEQELDKINSELGTDQADDIIGDIEPDDESRGEDEIDAADKREQLFGMKKFDIPDSKTPDGHDKLKDERPKKNIRL